MAHLPAPRRPSSRLHLTFMVFGAGVGMLMAFGAVAVCTKEKDGRGAEPRVALAQIAKGISASYAATGELCPSGRAIPRDFETIRGAKAYTAPSTEWTSDPGWSCTGFVMPYPQRYQYRLDTNGSFVTIVAAGDYDGDDLRATYELHGHVDAQRHRVVFEPAIRESNPGE